MRRTLKSLAFLLGICLLLYPAAGEIWNGFRQLGLERVYEETQVGGDRSLQADLLAKADRYNREHRNNTLDASGMGTDYAQQLVLREGDVLGILDIPGINVHLEIRHGTGGDVLKKGAGHLPGTSLPVGGESTHAVLSAHCGLPGSRLFTDLDRLVPGDRVYLTTAGRVLVYAVTGQEVVLPEGREAAAALSIQEGKDLLTLVTCTPYGINTHRRLVHCSRVEEEALEVSEKIREGRVTAWKELWLKSFTAAALTGSAVFAWLRTRKAY